MLYGNVILPINWFKSLNRIVQVFQISEIHIAYSLTCISFYTCVHFLLHLMLAAQHSRWTMLLRRYQPHHHHIKDTCVTATNLFCSLYIHIFNSVSSSLTMMNPCKCTDAMQKHTQAVYLPANQYTHFNSQPVCLPQASDGKTNKNS